MRRYLDDIGFKGRYELAHGRLRAAEQMLWQGKPEDDLTTMDGQAKSSVTCGC
ncbi:MAG: hypothetical protein H0V84_01425 [Actinobacteria bacterium]|nr:hypothetical protein [Actinomycetota bacterium]